MADQLTTLCKEVSALVLRGGEDPPFLLSEIKIIAAELGAHGEPMNESNNHTLFLTAFLEAYEIDVRLLEGSVSRSQ